MDTQTAETGTNGGLAQNLRHMVDDAEQAMHSAADSGDRKLEAMRQKVERQLKRMRLQLDELEQTTIDKARQAARATDQAVHTHPYSAMGAAVAVGVLIGLLIARR